LQVALTVVCLLPLAPTAAGIERQDIIRPEEARPGAKGFGLTVFRGSEPERFDVEVLGRLRNALPAQDLVLVRCRGGALAESKIVAGMSGSPVYLEDADGKARLLGAIAYSWSFQVDAVAGVTPITNMLEGLEAFKVAAAAERRPAFPPVADGGPIGAYLLGEQPFAADPAPGGLRPIATPVIVSGVPSVFMGELRRALAPWGLEPVQGGSGSGEADAEPRGLRPGDAMGVQLMRGDSDWTAIGTVTHVDGPHVLAFGHPFLLAGPWEAPVTRAEIEWTLARDSFSFKLANSGRPVGRLVDDRQPCVVAELGRPPAMVPCEVEVRGRGRQGRTFRYEVVQHPSITGVLSLFAVMDSVYAAYPWEDDALLTVSQRIELADGRSVSLRSVEAASGVFSSAMASPLRSLLANPFERVKIARLEYRIDVEPGRRTAEIVSVRASSREVRAGAQVTLRVRLRPFGAADAELDVPVQVPEEPRRGQFTAKVSAARLVRPDVAPPQNLDDYLAELEAAFRYPATSLVVVTEGPTRGLRDRGRVLPALPASVVNVLSPAGVAGAAPSADPVHKLVDTKWVLSGSASLTLEVVD